MQEDEGAKQAVDADTAVLQAKTGHQVKKKKEWYIWLYLYPAVSSSHLLSEINPLIIICIIISS